MSEAALVEGLSFTFVGRDQPSLVDVSCRLPQASWTIVTGRTGSGKSTFLRALAGLIPHHSSGTMQGRVRLFGHDTATARPAQLARQVGLVLQSPDEQLCATTVEAEAAFGLENLATPVEEIGPRIEDCLKRMGLEGLERRATRQLSGGQKQRLLLASILAMRPRLLLLDEPLSQLDPAAAAELLCQLDGLRATGLAIVLAEHRLDEVLSLADRVLVFDGGRLAGDFNPQDHGALAEGLARHGLEAPELSRLAQRLGLPPGGTLEELAGRFAPYASTNGPPAAPSLVSRPSPLLTVRDVAFRYPGTPASIWQGVSFSLAPGERVALVGANGSGKSTLLSVLAGLLPADTGALEWARQEDPARPATGLLFQNPDLMLFCRTVREELAFGMPRQLSAEERQARALRLAEELSLVELLEEPPLALSQGQRLRVAVAAVLALEPRLLLLDEPTTAQDRRQLSAMMELLSRDAQGRRGIAGLLFSTHDLGMVAAHADRVLVLGDQKLLADVTPGELLDDDALIRSAGLRRPPLYELRKRLGLVPTTFEGIAAELATRSR
jgi:energy-coupling factor transporter ATP-binding protein EcfA2